jgi:hypothetical protein
MAFSENGTKSNKLNLKKRGSKRNKSLIFCLPFARSVMRSYDKKRLSAKKFRNLQTKNIEQLAIRTQSR